MMTGRLSWSRSMPAPKGGPGAAGGHRGALGMTGPAQPDGAAGQGIAGRLALDGDLAPSVRELALLQQWHSLHSGVQRLTSGLLADVEAENGLTPSSFQALM